MPLLEVSKLTKNFGGLTAVNEFDLSIGKGEIVGLIGPNGAGKTTAFNIISGVYTPTRGKIVFNGHDITGKRPNVIAAKGLVRTFQLTTLFSNYSVLDNVMAACHLKAKAGFWKALFNTPGYRGQEMGLRQRSREILGFMGLAEMEDELAKNLSHGHQRLLEVAIALAVEPRLLLLDEPVTGMNVEEIDVMMELIRKLRDTTGVTVLLVEHHMRAVMGLCDRIAVLNYGKKIAEGTPREIADNKEVIEAYLGGTENVA